MNYEVLLCCFVKKCPVPAHTVSMERSLMMKKFFVLSAVWFASTEHAENLHTIHANGSRLSKKLQISKNTIVMIILYKKKHRKVFSGVSF